MVPSRWALTNQSLDIVANARARYESVEVSLHSKGRIDLKIFSDTVAQVKAVELSRGTFGLRLGYKTVGEDLFVPSPKFVGEVSSEDWRRTKNKHEGDKKN